MICTQCSYHPSVFKKSVDWKGAVLSSEYQRWLRHISAPFSLSVSSLRQHLSLLTMYHFIHFISLSNVTFTLHFKLLSTWTRAWIDTVSATSHLLHVCQQDISAGPLEYLSQVFALTATMQRSKAKVTVLYLHRFSLKLKVSWRC